VFPPIAAHPAFERELHALFMRLGYRFLDLILEELLRPRRYASGGAVSDDELKPANHTNCLATFATPWQVVGVSSCSKNSFACERG
jgi:hypothetical protein